MKPPGMGKKIAKIKTAKAKAAKTKDPVVEAAKAKTDVAGDAWILSQLRDLRGFRAKLENVQWPANGKLEDDRSGFILLLSAPSASGVVPGIPQGMGHKRLFECESEADRRALRVYLKQSFRITDEESLLQALNNTFVNHREYEEFRPVWAGRPGFDVNIFNPQFRKVFVKKMTLAAKLREVCGNGSFLAWDVSESTCLARSSHAAGLISREGLWRTCDPLAVKAAAYYDNWGEYALSCACGAVYQFYRHSITSIFSAATASNYLARQLSLLEQFIEPGGIWRSSVWPKHYPTGKKFCIDFKDLILMKRIWDGPIKCVASDRIMVDGAKVGFMCRDNAGFDGDSGWRLFAGDESEEYLHDPKNMGMYDLNMISNFDPDILEFLDLETGSMLRRLDGGPLLPYSV